MSKSISLTQYLLEQQRLHNNIPAQLRLLIEVVARACKRISISVNKGALGSVLPCHLIQRSLQIRRAHHATVQHMGQLQVLNEIGMT